jgi:pimeloyl-ACP methyl ester carboxylesterase
MSVMSKPVVKSPEPGPVEVVVRDRRVTVDGLGTQYLEAGVGPPVLLLHGHEQSATGWRWVLPALARTHRVLALSLPGHGETDPAVGGHAPGRDLAPFVAGFLDALGVGALDVVGHSAGGVVASAGLGRHCNPLLALDTLPGLGELAILLARMPGGNLQRTSMSAALLFAQPWRVPAEFFTEQQALGMRPGQLEASTAMARALFDANGQREVLLDQLPTLDMPTLVAWGASDYVLPAHQAHHAVALLPRGRLSMFPDCGHLPHVERPEQFAAVLTDWLTEDHDIRPQLRLAT